jgi:aminoglycoside phosphotransferase (APT) family kinase protein
MLKNLSNKDAFDLQKLKDYLLRVEWLQDKHSELDIKQFTNGYSNLTYQITAGNQKCVLRRPPHGAVKYGHDMGREYKVQDKLSKVFDKLPKVYAFCEDNAVMGAPFYLMEKVEGVILNLFEAQKRKISSSEFRIISNSWLDTWVELHRVDLHETDLRDLGKPVGYVERQISNWSKQYVKAATQEIPSAHKVMEWMADSQPTTYDHCLIHNDYRYDNVVFANDSWEKIHAVLDWEMCTIGDPLMDLGTTLGYWTMASDGPLDKIGIPSPTIMNGNPGRIALAEMYEKKSGRKVDHLVFYYVFGLFKIAVIAQQIFYRFDKGLATNPKFAHLDQLAKFLSDMAWQAIRKDRIEDLF